MGTKVQWRDGRTYSMAEIEKTCFERVKNRMSLAGIHELSPDWQSKTFVGEGWKLELGCWKGFYPTAMSELKNVLMDDHGSVKYVVVWHRRFDGAKWQAKVSRTLAKSWKMIFVEILVTIERNLPFIVGETLES